MWLGRDTVRLDLLREFLCESVSRDEPLVVYSPLGQLTGEDRGSFALKRASLLRGAGPTVLVFNADKRTAAAPSAGELLDAIARAIDDAGEASAVVKISTGGKLHQLRGDIKLDRGDGADAADGGFFLSSSSIMTQVFEGPHAWPGARSNADPEPAGQIAANPDREVPDGEPGRSETELDAWNDSWAGSWSEIDIETLNANWNVLDTAETPGDDPENDRIDVEEDNTDFATGKSADDA